MARKELSAKQKRFVDEYLIDLNATEAAKRAGYSERNAASIGSRLVKKSQVSAAIKKAKQVRSVRTQITADRVLEELARVGFSDIRKLFAPNGTLKAITELDHDAAAAISSVEVYEEFEGQGENRKLSGYIKKLKLWDKLNALEKMGKHLNLFKELSPLETLLGLFPAELREAVSGLLAQSVSEGRDTPSG